MEVSTTVLLSFYMNGGDGWHGSEICAIGDNAFCCWCPQAGDARIKICLNNVLCTLMLAMILHCLVKEHGKASILGRPLADSGAFVCSVR